MASNRISAKFLKSFACSHLTEDFFEDEGWDMMNCIMQTEGSPIPKIKALKERGNNLYKQNCFGAAASCYDEACKLLSLVVGMEEDNYDTNSVTDLAVSLNLNLAACALKLCEHEASKDHCSIVLSFFPHNVKALFRRGLAFMKLNKVLEAISDLEAALLIEPRNKDILRELCVVKNCLAINSNGKRSIADHTLQDPTGKGRVEVQEDEPPLKALRESSRVGLTSCHDNNVNFSGESLTLSAVTQKCDMELVTDKLVSDQQSGIHAIPSSTSEVTCKFDGCAMVNSLDESGTSKVLNRDSHGVEKKVLQFSKKGGGHSVLKIDAGTYKKLLDGKKVSFFQKSHLSTMKIRVLQPSIKETDTGSVTSHRKKRKRRKRKNILRTSTPTTMADGINSYVSPLSSVVLNKPIDCDLPVEKVNSSLSCELVNHQELCGSSGVNSHQPPYFVFSSSKVKVTKMFHARRLSTRIQSRREESPRRNVYIYSGKFPRPRDVSVSCCRYFPKAQLQKKRKEPTSSLCYSSMCYSNKSLKKPRVSSNPTPSLSLSLSLCINNVVLAPDLSGPMCSS